MHMFNTAITSVATVSVTGRREFVMGVDSIGQNQLIVDQKSLRPRC